MGLARRIGGKDVFDDGKVNSDQSVIVKQLTSDVVVTGGTSISGTEFTALSVTGLDPGYIYEYHFTWHGYMGGAKQAMIMMSFGDSITDPRKMKQFDIYIHTATGEDMTTATYSGHFVADYKGWLRLFGQCPLGSSWSLSSSGSSNTGFFTGVYSYGPSFARSELTLKRLGKAAGR